MNDFDELFDSVVLRAASTQTGNRSRMVSVTDLCREVLPSVGSDWIRAVNHRIKELGFGELIRDSEARNLFYWSPNGAALSHASKVKRAREPLSLSDRIASEKFNKIATLTMALLSLVISAAALVVAYLAFVKTR